MVTMNNLGMLITHDKAEAVRIITDAGLEVDVRDNIVIGIIRSEILDNGFDYMVIWEPGNEYPGAFKLYDILYWIDYKDGRACLQGGQIYAESVEELKWRVKALFTEIKKAHVNYLNSILDKLA